MARRPRCELIINGRIATLAGDRGFGWTEAIAIGDGRVLASGAAHDIEDLATSETERWRLGTDQVVLPGITDAHLHLMTAAQEQMELDLHDAPDRDAILARVAEAHSRMTSKADDGWLLGHGWSLDRIGSWPTVEDLERVAPGRSVSLWAHDHHSRWVSGPALLAAGITNGTPDPDGGLIRRGPDGTATGLLHEHACKLVNDAIPRPTDESLETALRDYSQRLAELGVVAAHDPGELFDDPAIRWGPTFYRRLALDGRLPLRVAASVRPEQIDRAREIGFHSGESVASQEPREPEADRRAARYRGGWLKLFADGSLGSRSAALLEPYEPEPDGRQPTGGPAGMLLDPPEVLLDYARRAMAAGIAVQIHGIGDAAVRAALDILETLPPHPDGVCHRVEHAQLIHVDDLRRFGASGIVASAQPCHIASDAEVARRAWGSRSAGAFPLRSIIDGGGSVAIGTDAPVESPTPWPGIAQAVGRDFHPEQSIDLAWAIRSACLEPAISAGETDRGRLVAGNLADLVVIDSAAIDEPVRIGGSLSGTRPLATMIDGMVVHRVPGFAT